MGDYPPLFLPIFLLIIATAMITTVVILFVIANKRNKKDKFK